MPLHKVYMFSMVEVCFRARNWQLWANLKFAKCGKFCTQKHSILATPRFFQFWQILLPDVLWMHSIPHLIALWCCQNGYIRYSSPVYPDVAIFAQCFFSTPITYNCWFWLPFLENLDIGFFDTYILSSGKLAKMLWILSNLASIMKKTQFHYVSWCTEV